MWWVMHNEDGAFMARRSRPSALHQPARASGHCTSGQPPVAANAANDPITLPAFQAMARHLMQEKE